MQILTARVISYIGEKCQTGVNQISNWEQISKQGNINMVESYNGEKYQTGLIK